MKNPIIPLHDVSWQSYSWQWHLSHAITSAPALLEKLSLALPSALTDFPVRVPLPWLARMEPGNPDDPLLRQVFPYPEETVVIQGKGEKDPLQESRFSPTPGVLQKYHARALIISTGQCAIHCRYCFRRHFPYHSFQPDTDQWQSILTYLREEKALAEVILSGGDPLTLNDGHLLRLITDLSAIPHLRVLRIHTRFPIVIPQRVTPSLLDALATSRLKTVMVVHINHAREIDTSVKNAMQSVASGGTQLLNQSVLLRGINDNLDALEALSWALADTGVLPYYLHLMDDVQGAHHYQVGDAKGKQLVEDLRARLPGYLVPGLAREEPGRPSKTLFR